MKRNSSKTSPKRSLGGFTLVELVVVIAVLAILAGVGAVAYNGYIEYTQKGVDRALVGELMHAVELADYADPTLFGENSFGLITISEDGIKVGGSSDSDKLKSAIEDAMSLDQTLASKNWTGVNGSAIKNGSFTKYQSWANDFKTTPASFAGDMEEYWDVFTDMVNGIREGTLIDENNVSLSLVQGHESQFTNDVIDKYNKNVLSNETLVNNIITAWADLNSFGNLGYRVDLQVARNYSFVSFASRSGLDAGMQKELEDYKKDLASFTNINDFFDVDTFKADKWAPVVNAYKTHGSSDAKAYLSLMEAAGEVSNQLKGGDTSKVLDDQTLLGAISEHVGMVGGLISGQIDFKEMQSLIGELDGNDIRIDITKTDGVLSFDVSPDDADPREKENDLEYDSKVTLTYDTKTKSFSIAETTIHIAPGGSCDIYVENTNGATFLTRTNIETSPDGTIASAEKKSGNYPVTVTGVNSGNTSLTLSTTTGGSIVIQIVVG